MKIFVILALLAPSLSFAKIIKVLELKNKTQITYEDFIHKLNARGFIVLGEFHNTPHIQNAQAKIIQDKASFENASVNLMWEFLNFTDQKEITKDYIRLQSNEVTTSEFIIKHAGQSNIGYASIFNAIKDLKSGVYGLNAPRSVKKKLMDEGLESLPQNLVPPNMYIGGADYEQRFIEAMGGHAPESVIKKYFLAQCYTDSIMAYKAFKNEGPDELNFIIAGSFHTDYYDATVARLKELTKSALSSVKIIDEKMIQGDLMQVLHSPQYGEIADFVVFTTED